MEETIVLPSDHFRKRVKAQYRDVRLAIVREVLQNSKDAGATRVDFTITDGSWAASDDGCGMDLPGFRQFFLTLGGTKKRTHSIGGFGAAKEVLSFAWPTWYAKGQGFRVDGKGASPPISKEADYAGVPKGFELGASDPDMFTRYDVASSVKSVTHRSDLNMDVYINGELIPVQKPDMTLHKRFKWGDLMLVNGPSHGWMGSGYVYIRHGGLHSSEKYIGGPNTFVLELNTNMDADKVFTESRDALKHELNAELDKATAELREKAHKKPNPVIILYNGANRPRNTNALSGDGTRDVRIHTDTKTKDEVWLGIDFPFAIYSDNGPRKMLKKYIPMIRLVEKALRLTAKTFETTMPVPGLLILSKDTDILGQHQGDGEYARGILFSLDAVNDGPVALVAYMTHEFAHDQRSWHDEGFSTFVCALPAKAGLSYVKLMLDVASAYKEFGIKY